MPDSHNKYTYKTAYRYVIIKQLIHTAGTEVYAHSFTFRIHINYTELQTPMHASSLPSTIK